MVLMICGISVEAGSPLTFSPSLKSKLRIIAAVSLKVLLTLLTLTFILVFLFDFRKSDIHAHVKVFEG